MAVTIRLARQGAKKSPQYLIVVVDSAKKRDGAHLKALGHYYPKAKTAKEKLQIDAEALKAWQAKGAKLSQTVGQLVKTLAK
ncbi:MAG: 30S ribosomal protein S16 [Oligoflexia bacterium]|nr:30S ribosomal protein S16 [Oligoflexia bacterium]